MSIHRITLRQREWQEAFGAALLAAIVSLCILVSASFSQESASPAEEAAAEALQDADSTAPAADEVPQQPASNEAGTTQDLDTDEQEYTGPPATHVLGMQIIEQQGRGALVSEVDPLSPAAEAGLKKGDLLLIVAGAKTVPYDDFLKLLRDKIEKRTKGDEINIAAMRGGKDIQLSVTERVGTEERKEDVREMAEEYSARKAEAKRFEEPYEPEGEPSLSDLLSGERASDSMSDTPPPVPSAGGVSQPDVDYYFGSGGLYGGALTLSQQQELDRLSRDSDRSSLSADQQQRLDELNAMEMSRFDDLDPLDDSGRQELQDLLTRHRGEEQLTADDRARLRQLIGRELSRDGNFREQRESLEQLAGQRTLNSREQMRLDLLKTLGPDAQSRVSNDSLQSLRELAGSAYGSLPPQVRERMQTLADNPQRLTPAEKTELNQLRFQAESMLARQLRGEYFQAQQMMANGQQFTPAQESRYQQLQRNMGRFTTGVNQHTPVTAGGGRFNALEAGGAIQAPASAAPGQQGIGSGSGIGLGGQGGPSSQGSGIGTADGPGIGSAPMGGTVGGGSGGGGGGGGRN